MRRLAIAAALLALAACGGPRPRGEGDYLLEGTVRDAKTGEPVARDTLYLHFFCDGIDHQVTLDPSSETEYAVRMPQPTVRVRVADTDDAYHLYERTVEIEGKSRTLDLPLEPTGFVLLRGRVVDAADGSAVPRGADGGHGPLLYLSGDGWSEGPVSLEEDGSFTLRVPRAKIEIRAVDTARSIANPDLDLTGFAGASRKFELRLE